MTGTIRLVRPNEIDEVLTLTRAAFPDEDLVPLMRQLLSHEAVLTLVAETDGAISGFICWTRCRVADDAGVLALLGPLAAHPDLQRQGIGGALIRAGLQKMRDEGAVRSVVLGDPAYYGRFGYGVEENISTPYPLPEEWHGAWQGLALSEDAQPQGQLTVPEPWQPKELWLP